MMQDTFCVTFGGKKHGPLLMSGQTQARDREAERQRIGGKLALLRKTRRKKVFRGG